MDYQSLGDVVLVPGLGVAGSFQVLQAMQYIPGKVVRVPWAKEELKSNHVIPAAILCNLVFRLDVNPPGRGADHNRQEFIDLDNVSHAGRVEWSS